MTFHRFISALLSPFLVFLVSASDGTPRVERITDLSNSTCESKSKFWDPGAYSALDGSCERLMYDKQYCQVEKEEWDCLRQRALMHDEISCGCIRPDHDVHACIFVEVCAFVDPSFECDENYKCTVDEDDVIHCSGNGLSPYENKCLRGLFHCPTGEPCDSLNLEAQFSTTIKDYCGSNYTEHFGTNVTIYIIDQVHHVNVSSTFGNITALIVAKNDQNNSCKRSHVNYSGPLNPSNQSWASIISVVIIFIAVVALSYGMYKFNRYRKSQNKKVDAEMSNTVGGAVRFVFDVDVPDSGMDQMAATEVPEPITEKGPELTVDNTETKSSSGVSTDNGDGYQNGGVNLELHETVEESINISELGTTEDDICIQPHSYTNSVHSAFAEDFNSKSGVYFAKNDVNQDDATPLDFHSDASFGNRANVEYVNNRSDFGRLLAPSSNIAQRNDTQLSLDPRHMDNPGYLG